MKKTAIIVVLVLFAVQLQGQFKFGVSGGMNFSYVSPKTLSVADYHISTLDDRYTGFHIGLMSQISVLGIFIQPELLYTSIGNEMRVDEAGEPTQFYSRKINRLDIPVMVGTKLGPVRIGVAPVGSILLSESSELKEIVGEDSRENYNDMTFGLQFGFGFDVSNLLIDFRYEYGLSALGDGVMIDGEELQFDSRPKQIIVSLGIVLN